MSALLNKMATVESDRGRRSETKVKPISLFAIKYGAASEDASRRFGKPIGFDLEKADWVAPYGKGECADFIFRLDQSN